MHNMVRAALKGCMIYSLPNAASIQERNTRENHASSPKCLMVISSKEKIMPMFYSTPSSCLDGLWSVPIAL